MTLLRDVLGVRVPKHSEIRLTSEALRQVQPVELAADAVFLLLRKGKPVLAIILESQLRDDEDKSFSWPVYVTLVRREYRCPAVILVVTADETVADNAGRAIALGGGSVLRPIVLGPSRIPRVVDEEVAVEHIELAVLSALTHGRDDETLAVVRPTLEALGRAPLDDERRRTYAHMVLEVLGRAAWAALEAQMKFGEKGFVSSFAMEIFAKGKAEGEAHGRAEGEAHGEAKALLVVLEARGLKPSRAVAARVRAGRDPEQLPRWVQRAAVATSLDEVFADS